MKKMSFIIIVLYIFICSNLMSEMTKESTSTGTIKGSIFDKYSISPLPGAIIILLNGEYIKTVSDINGNFIFKDVKVGSYKLKILVGENTPLFIPDILIRPNRITNTKIAYNTTPIII